MIDSRRSEEPDFFMMNFYCSKSERVTFTQNRVVNLCTEQGSLALTNDVLTVRDQDGMKKQILSTEEERRCCLEQVFGIIL